MGCVNCVHPFGVRESGLVFHGFRDAQSGVAAPVATRGRPYRGEDRGARYAARVAVSGAERTGW